MKYLLVFIVIFSLSNAWALPKCIKSESNWNNCQGTHTYKNGDIYEGEWKDNIIHGQGTYSFSNGDKFIGEFKEGKRHGKGKFIAIETENYKGHIYEGEYKNGQKDGKGFLNFDDGNWYYKGEFKNGKYHGQGEHVTKNFRYLGSFENGKRNGKGILISYYDGSKYVGTFKDNAPHGYGVRSKKDYVSEGVFVKNNLVNGTIKFEDSGIIHQGEFAMGLILTKGTKTLKNGIKFVGEFNLKNQRHGFVTSYMPDGYIFKGNYKNDKMHGFIILEDSNGNKAYAQYDNGKQIEGTFTSVPNQNTQQILKNLTNIQGQILSLKKQQLEINRKEREERKHNAQIDFLYDFSDRMLQRGKYKNEQPKQNASRQNIDLLIENKIDDALRNCRYHPNLCGL